MGKKEIYTPCFRLKNGLRVWFRQPDVKVFVGNDGRLRNPTGPELTEIVDHVRGIIDAQTGPTGIK